MEPGRADLLKFKKHFERAQGWLLLENHAAADRALRLIPAAFRGRPFRCCALATRHRSTVLAGQN